MLPDRWDRKIIIGVDPQGKRFERTPDGDTGDNAPEYIIPDLVTPEEFIVFATAIEPAIVELVVLLLALAHVKPPMQATGNQAQQHSIAYPDLCDPAKFKFGHADKRWRQVVPTCKKPWR